MSFLKPVCLSSVKLDKMFQDIITFFATFLCWAGGIVAYDALFNPTLNVRKIPSQIRSHVMQFVALPLINLFILPAYSSKRAGQDSQ